MTTIRHAGKRALPQLTGGGGGEAAVDGDPGVAILNEPQVHMVQPIRQWHAQPQHPGHHFRRLAERRWLGMQGGQAVGWRGLRCDAHFRRLTAVLT